MGGYETCNMIVTIVKSGSRFNARLNRKRVVQLRLPIPNRF
jgi:hypothetical protein